MKNNYYIYIVAMALVTYLIRVLPLTLLRKPITNRFFRSFLYYVPYVTLAVMTFPAILFSTSRLLYGGMAFAVGIVLAWTSGNLFVVELGCCLVVLLMNAVLH
ncbi:MAG: AzlD domain-containing protein [Lachnospiraceae bacterium]|jgi:branched-subunit amino acid transport protein|nr:AzlD domain-containing protein [Lachnospiraceae bacterium]MBR2531981.1 AzlD domain-containing protein [Lachnospiraceae bacterium]